jgi:hypothetical protein
MATKKMVGVNKYIECANAGMSKAEAAAALGVSIQAVFNAAKKFGITYRDGRLKKVQGNFSDAA